MMLNRVHFGDCRDSMRMLIDAGVRVNCVVTSPPYFGLRRYTDSHQEIGIEQSLSEYVTNMIEVFRLVRELLADDGVVFLNLGDSRAGSGKGQTKNGNADPKRAKINGMSLGKNIDKVPAKNIYGVPWKVAFALQDDGWILRQGLVWNKENSLPEPVTDRFVDSHEYIFLLTKKPHYFFDVEAVREPASTNEGRAAGIVREREFSYQSKRNSFARQSKNKDKPEHRPDREFVDYSGGMRNRRSVWTINTVPYKGAHTAVFPPELVEVCVLSSTSAHGHCPKCGAGWEREITRGGADLEHQRACGGDTNGEYHGEATKDYEASGAQNASSVKARILNGMRERITTGWKPSCECGVDPVPGIVFDPFGGSGTTAEVAQSLGRDWLLCELNEDNAPLQRQRIQQMGLAV